MDMPGDSEVNWAVEVVMDPDEHGDSAAEYYSATALSADGELVVITTPDGSEVIFQRDNVTKILVMRTEYPALPPASDDD